MVTKQENDSFGLAGFQVKFKVVRADRLPTVRNRVARLPHLHCQRFIPTPVGSQEGIPLGVESGQRLRTGKPGKMVAPFAVLSLMKDGSAQNISITRGSIEIGRFHFSRVEIALEVG